MVYLVGVIEQSPLYRSGVSNTLKGHGFEVVELDALRPPAEAEADVFVVSAGGPSGRELIRETRASHPDKPVVAIVPSSWNGPQHHAAVLIDGAIAAVSRDAPPSVVASVVRAALADWAVLVLPGEDIRAFHALFLRVLGDEPQPLEEDEVSLLLLLLQGATRQTLAEKLHFAPRTVDRHIQAVYRKLNATNQTDAILRALFWGCLTRSSVPVKESTLNFPGYKSRQVD